jgi:hypothetical protein
VSGDLWRAEAEFVVSRRVPWEADEGLRPHIDQVVGALRDCEAAAEIEVNADLDSANVVLSITVVVYPDDEGRYDDGDAIARAAISEAIRHNGGRHEDLLPLVDEAVLATRSGPWPGLRTPQWALFQLTGHAVVAD